MKKFIIQACLLAIIFVFMIRGGVRVLVLGWKFILPLLLFGAAYLFVRSLLQKEKINSVNKKTDRVGDRHASTADPIRICPNCGKPVGSCAQCRELV